MRNLITRTLLGSTLLFGAITANAQYYPRYERGQYNQTYREHGWLLNRIQNDLNRAEASSLPFSGDRMRLNRIEAQVSRFQDQLNDGNYDRMQLNRIISTMERELDRNSLPAQSREVVSDDLSRLRDLRLRLD